jgi:hypothetical protein
MNMFIKLFNCIRIRDATLSRISFPVLRKTALYGFIFAPEVAGNYTDAQLLKFMTKIEKELGLTPDQLNKTFHKSWGKVITADIEQLFLEQLLHYITTYGYKAMGLFNSDSVYIPKEQLEIPNITEDIKLMVIKGYTDEQLKEKTLRFLNSGIALKEATIQDVLKIMESLEIEDYDLETIKNREIKCILYDKLSMIPSDPIEFIRFLVYKSTKSALLIKSKEAFQKIRMNSKNCIEAIQSYEDITKLGEVFYRYRPIFIALRSARELRPIINKIHKLAPKYHKPMVPNYLDTITSQLKHDSLNLKTLASKLKKANIFHKSRLLYALTFLATNCKAIVYKIRNGKAWASRSSLINSGKLYLAIELVRQSIITDVSKRVAGKKVFFDKNVVYSLPATEKQFSGDIPSSSYITLTDNIILAVYWENVDDQSTDLDLSLINQGKIGWDGDYRSEGRDVLHSGDLTDATNGATEAVYLEYAPRNNYVVMLNNFSFHRTPLVPYKFFIAHTKVENIYDNYTVDPNTVQLKFSSLINKKQKMLGYLMSINGEVRFYFNESSIGNRISSSSDAKYMDWTREYLATATATTIPLREILIDAGAIPTDNKKDSDIDLSIEGLEKDTILRLLK